MRVRTGASSSVLAQRLRELTAGGVVERDGARRYRLTAAGRELARVLYDLNRWAEAAARESESAQQGGEAILGA
jgi:DNA-binding HxlR family transcriptional regulator